MLASIGLALVRVVVGGLFIGHGLQKLTRAFGGHGIAGTAQSMEALGLRPGRPWAIAAGLAEAVGGLLFGVGFLTPVAAVFLTGVMLMAIARVHASKGPWVQNGGYEYPLVNVAVAVGVALAGPGAYALDPYLRLAPPTAPVLAIGLALALIVVAAAAPRAAARTAAEHSAQPAAR